MNKEVKKKWIAALRSGEYDQATGFLRTQEDQYCCLGVLCDLYAKEGLGEWKCDEDNEDYPYMFFPNTPNSVGAEGLLPKEVMEWAGLESIDGGFHIEKIPTTDSMFSTLSELNDQGDTFTTIADIIQEVF